MTSEDPCYGRVYLRMRAMSRKEFGALCVYESAMLRGDYHDSFRFLR